jgi:hypothetical protein
MSRAWVSAAAFSSADSAPGRPGLRARGVHRIDMPQSDAIGVAGADPPWGAGPSSRTPQPGGEAQGGDEAAEHGKTCVAKPLLVLSGFPVHGQTKARLGKWTPAKM